MAWWFMKGRPRRVAAHADLDVVLDTSADDRFVPPQLETLFDADEYLGDFAQGEPGPEEAASPEPETEPETLPAPVHGPGPEAGSERAIAHDLRHHAEAAAEPDHDAEPVSGLGPELDPEDEPRPAPATHARRRAHGRSWRSRSARERPSAEVTGPAPVPVKAKTGPAEAPAHARQGRISRVRGALGGWGRRAVAVGLIVLLLLGAVYALPLLAGGINWLARWNKLRTATSASVALPSQDNLLVIGVSDGVVVGFVAMKAERSTSKVLGIAIPDGAFVEVPGQGFERVGASYLGGPKVSEDAISNFFGVTFDRYIVVDGTAYQTLLRSQDVSGLMNSVVSTDLTTEEKAAFTSYFSSVAVKDVWLAPLPVKPVAVGDQRYFEPQKKEIADLLLQWWGVQASQAQVAPRVIVYNGVGTPGLAGIAAQQLIRAGFRIIDSTNATHFGYTTTEIHLFHGTQADADAVRASLGVGTTIMESAPQELTDMIVIIGADYRPPTSDITTVPTEGVQ